MDAVEKLVDRLTKLYCDATVSFCEPKPPFYCPFTGEIVPPPIHFMEGVEKHLTIPTGIDVRQQVAGAAKVDIPFKNAHETAVCVRYAVAKWVWTNSSLPLERLTATTNEIYLSPDPVYVVNDYIKQAGNYVLTLGCNEDFLRAIEEQLQHRSEGYRRLLMSQIGAIYATEGPISRKTLCKRFPDLLAAAARLLAKKDPLDGTEFGLDLHKLVYGSSEKEFETSFVIRSWFWSERDGSEKVDVPSISGYTKLMFNPGDTVAAFGGRRYVVLGGGVDCTYNLKEIGSNVEDFGVPAHLLSSCPPPKFKVGDHVWYNKVSGKVLNIHCSDGCYVYALQLAVMGLAEFQAHVWEEFLKPLLRYNVGVSPCNV